MPHPEFFGCPTIIPYYGGKRELSRRLVPLISPHRRYFEVFFGGGSMYFRKSKAEWNILNDLNDFLVNLYMCVIDHSDELMNEIYWTPRSRRIFVDYQKVIKEKEPFEMPNIKIAAQYFYVIRNAFNNIASLPFSKDTYWKTEIVDYLKVSKKKLDGATMENLDFESLIKRYEPRKEDFFYMDPPYFITTKKTHYYQEVLTVEDHTRLKIMADLINDNGAQFMISYDDMPEIRELYKDYNIDTIATKYVGRNHDAKDNEGLGKEYSELIITNYEHYHSQIDLF